MVERITRRGMATGALGGAVVLAASSSALAGPTVKNPTVETSTGKVRGVRHSGVSSYLGIPYGLDTHLTRFQPPRPAEPWTGVRDCLAFGPQAPQMEIDEGSVDLSSPFVKQILAAFKEGIEVGHESEACLVLNVYTPEASRARKRPVMVWLHGGGFAMGSSADPQYNGSALCRRGDVVVVTLNHRLNVPGYLYLGALHEDFADSGNSGTLDQILALKWVRDNIAAFGGDPSNVTIFGESGGGAKVSTLMAAPEAQGLFHKAIIQSGPGVTMIPQADAAAFAEHTLAQLGVHPADVHQLQTMDVRRIIAASRTAAAAFRGHRTLAPVVDGRALPRDPFKPDAPQISRNVPLIIGTNKDESTLFLSADPLFRHFTVEQAQARFRAMLGPRGDAALALYRSLRPNDPPTYWVTAMMTDTAMQMDSIRIAERKAAEHAAPVYMYRFDWETPALGGVMRTPHGLDVPLVFDNPDTKRLILGNGPEPAKLAAVMSQAWIDFARSGNPSQPGLDWPAYDQLTRQTMLFNVKSHAVSDPVRAKREFWGV